MYRMTKEKLMAEYEQCKTHFWRLLDALKSNQIGYSARLLCMQLDAINSYIKVLELIGKDLDVDLGMALTHVGENGELTYSFAGPLSIKIKDDLWLEDNQIPKFTDNPSKNAKILRQLMKLGIVGIKEDEYLEDKKDEIVSMLKNLGVAFTDASELLSKNNENKNTTTCD